MKRNTADFSPAEKPSNVSFCSTLLLPKMPGTEMLRHVTSLQSCVHSEFGATEIFCLSRQQILK